MIEGRLINLRAREMSDRDRMTRWINDREVTRYMGATSRSRSRRKMASTSEAPGCTAHRPRTATRSWGS